MTLNNGGKMSRPDADRVKRAEPHFLREVAADNVVTVDVAALFEAQKEPLTAILEVVGQMKTGQVLKLKVPFEPVPLFGVLGAKGFSHWSVSPSEEDELWTIYFYQEGDFGQADDFNQSIFEEEGGALLEVDFRGIKADELL